MGYTTEMGLDGKIEIRDQGLEIRAPGGRCGDRSPAHGRKEGWALAPEVYLRRTIE